MTDPTMAEAGQPTPEELQAYLMQLRQADPAEFLMQAFNVLVTGAQAKIGLPDGRMLIDAAAGMSEAVAEHLPGELVTAVRNAVAQLQSAQVQAEQQLAAMGQTPESAAQEGGEPSTQPSLSEPERRMTDRLWVPGKGTPPIR